MGMSQHLRKKEQLQQPTLPFTDFDTTLEIPWKTVRTRKKRYPQQSKNSVANHTINRYT
jgi:hypothetical protein